MRTAKTDQTGRMPRLIVFAGRTCHFIGFVMRRLICSSAVLWYYISHSPIKQTQWPVRLVVAVRIKKQWTQWTHGEDWSDCVNADLSLRWAQVILFVLPCCGSYKIYSLYFITVSENLVDSIVTFRVYILVEMQVSSFFFLSAQKWCECM